MCCKQGGIEENGEVKTLTFKEKRGVLKDTAFFKTRVMLPLETNNAALIGEISRIYMADDTLFILDDNFKNIIIYNKEGKYINSIQNVGAGPKEYIDLGDICVDNFNRELVVLCTRPSKLQFYSYQGEFLREKYLGDNYYSHLGVEQDFIYLHDDTGINKAKEISIYDRDVNFLKHALERGNVFENGEGNTVSHFGQGHTMTQDSSIHIVREFDNMVYEAKGGKVYPKYRLDFQEYTLPPKMLESRMKPFEFLEFCREKQYVISLKEVMENSKFLLFTTNLGIFIGDKESGEMVKYAFLEDAVSGMGSSDIQIIGNTHKLVTIWQASKLKQMVERRLENPNVDENDVDFLKTISAMDEEANAILFIYDL